MAGIFCLSVLLKVLVTVWIKRTSSFTRANYSEFLLVGCCNTLLILQVAYLGYLGYDYPDAWPIERPSVLMAFSHSVHFELDTPAGAAEWAATVPGDGMVYLGEEKRPYTISMLHQLRCLDILRAEIVRGHVGASDEPSYLSRHCLNYIKQMVLCRGDTNLEPFQYPNHQDPIDMEGIYECRDWGAVYAEVQKNQAQYAEWAERRG